jgi:hypothetical protein
VNNIINDNVNKILEKIEEVFENETYEIEPISMCSMEQYGGCLNIQLTNESPFIPIKFYDDLFFIPDEIDGKIHAFNFNYEYQFTMDKTKNGIDLDDLDEKKIEHRIQQQLDNGESFIWDSNSDKQELEEFLDYAINGLGQHYGYDRLIFGFDAKEGDTGDDSPPKAVAACRGDEEAFKTVLLFNEGGLICIVKNKPKD